MDRFLPDNEPAVGYLITKISYGIRQNFGNLFAEYGVTYSQSRVLIHLFSQADKRDVNQRELEYALGIKASSVSSLVRNLEKKDLIRCERMAKDTRNKRILLTEKGGHLRKKLLEATEKAEENLIRGLEPDQLEALRSSLIQLMNNLEQE